MRGPQLSRDSHGHKPALFDGRFHIRFVNQNLDGLSPLVRRDLIRLLVSRVEFGRTTMKVTLNAGGLLAVKSGPSGFFLGDSKSLEKGVEALWPKVTSLCQLSGLG